MFIERSRGKDYFSKNQKSLFVQSRSIRQEWLILVPKSFFAYFVDVFILNIYFTRKALGEMFLFLFRIIFLLYAVRAVLVLTTVY